MNDRDPLMTETVDSEAPTHRPIANLASEATVIADTGAQDAPASTLVADLSAPETSATRLIKAVPDVSLPAGVPREIGGVKLLRQLGKGAMGEVYLGRHHTMDVEVAVKLMIQTTGSDADRFLQEVRAAARIIHPHVIQVMNAGTDQGRLFLVMELVTGGDLSQMIKREGRLPWRRAVELSIQAAEGLGAAHRAGIVHRDVKPANFLLTGDGKLKVADLGMAKHQASSAVELTQTGVIMGTPAYMAPEQAIDTRRAGPPADVYALGVTLFHLLCGRLPYQAETSNAMLLAHANQPVPDVGTLAKDIPPQLVALVTRLLDKDPAKRPANGDATAVELRKTLNVGTVESVAVASSGARRFAALIAIGLVIGLTILGGIWLTAHRDPTPAPAVVQTKSPETPPVSGTPAAVTPGTAAPAIAALPQPVIDAWQTPVRAVFVLSSDPQAIEAAAIESALVTAKVLLVERAVLEQAVLKEATLISNGQVDVASAVHAGKLVGGHVALLIRKADQRLALRAVVIETGEVVGSQVVDQAAGGTTAVELVRAALSGLPAQGRLVHDADNTWQISLGRQHGVQIGDQFRVMSGEPNAPTMIIAKATVGGVSATTATVSLAGNIPSILPANVSRIAP